jgi:hypothetical protein
MVVTRYFSLEGHIHFPRLGKEGRRLSNMLNSDRKFIAMTHVKIINRLNGTQDPNICPFIQVNVESIEFIQPYEDLESEGREASPSMMP